MFVPRECYKTYVHQGDELRVFIIETGMESKWKGKVMKDITMQLQERGSDKEVLGVGGVRCWEAYG